MWIHTEIENYLLKQELADDNFTFYLTDLIHIWESKHASKAVIEKFKALNPLLDMTDVEIIKKINSLTGPDSGVTFFIEKEGDSIKLRATIPAGRISIKMELKFLQSSPETLYQQLSQHIFNCMNSLLKREETLVNIIKSKDAEIEEYKLEGITIKRNAVITTPFNYEEFERNKEISEPAKFPSSLLKGPLRDLLGKHTDSIRIKTEAKEEHAEEPAKKMAKITKATLPNFEPSGCLYKKDKVVSSSSNKRRQGKFFKL